MTSVNLKKNVVLIAVTQLSSVVFTFLSMSILLNTLGKFEYGIWLVITTMSSWLIQLDIGYTNGLRNRLTSLLTEDRIDLAKSVMGSSYYYFGLFTLFVVIVCGLVIGLVPDYMLFISEATRDISIRWSIFIVVLASFMHLFLGITNSLAYSMHISFIAPLRTAVLQFVLLLGAIYLQFSIDLSSKNNITYLSFLFLFAVVVSNVVTNIYTFYFKNGIKPDLNNKSLVEFKGVALTGSGFFVLQMTAVILFTSDTFLISYFIGAEYVPEYNLTNKLFLFLIMLQGFMMAPLWSYYTKLLVDKNIDRIFYIHKKTLLISLVLSLTVVPLVMFGDEIMYIWLRDSSLYNKELFAVLSVVTVLRFFSANYSTLFNGMSVLRYQVIQSIAAVFINLVATIYLIKVAGMGVVGVAVGTAIALMPYLVMSPTYLKKHIKEGIV